MAMTLRLTPEQDKALNSLAKARGISKHQLALEAIDREIQEQMKYELVSELGKRIMREHKGLLKRLEDA
jgi:predicted transcriptional regulator